MTNFNIEIVSDTVCPWCYVGKQKMDNAIKAYQNQYPESGDTFSITWKPYYLNPDAPKQGKHIFENSASCFASSC